MTTPELVRKLRNKLTSATAVQDQIHKQLELVRDDILRIAQHGADGSEEDNRKVQAIMRLLLGEMRMRELERMVLEMETEL